jgi:hypothetical protein
MGAKKAMDLREMLRQLVGRDSKPKSAFSSEREAYEFLNKVYKETGGPTPELRRAYEFYQANVKDECREFDGPIEIRDQVSDQ